MDVSEALIKSADPGSAVAVLGSGKDFVLVSLDGAIDETATERAKRNGFHFCGTFVTVGGVPHAHIEKDDPEAAYTLVFAGLAYAHRLAGQAQPERRDRDGGGGDGGGDGGDSVDWLESLYRLPDDRING